MMPKRVPGLRLQSACRRIWQFRTKQWPVDECRLTIAPTGNGDEKPISIVLDADGQGVLGDVVSAGHRLLLETGIREGEVELVPAVPLLELVGRPAGRHQEAQQQQQQLQDANVVLAHGTKHTKKTKHLANSIEKQKKSVKNSLSSLGFRNEILLKILYLN